MFFERLHADKTNIHKHTSTQVHKHTNKQDTSTQTSKMQKTSSTSL